MRLSFAHSGDLEREGTFAAEDVLNGTTVSRVGGCPGQVYVEIDNRVDRLCFYGAAGFRTNNIPLVFFEGDILERRACEWAVVDRYKTLGPALMQREAERFATMSGRTFVNIARPGTYGSSGDHRQRRRSRESALINAALDRLKQHFGWTRMDVAGLSGGGHVVGCLIAQRRDIDCAVIASGNCAVKYRNAERGQVLDATGYADFVDPIDLVDAVAGHAPRKLIMLTDLQDAVVSAASQRVYVDALRKNGLAIDHRFMSANDPRHHILRLEAIQYALNEGAAIDRY